MSSAVSTSQGIHPTTRLSSLESSHSKQSHVVPVQSDEGSNIHDEAELLSVSWNQNFACFSVGTSNGFRIYNCDSFKETIRRDLKGGGFKIVEMLYRTNIFALVGSDDNPQYPPNKVMIWDDHDGRCIGEFPFRSVVRAVKLSPDCVVVVLEHRIYVYAMLDMKLTHQIDTVSNAKGLCCLSHKSSNSVLACLGVRLGQVRVDHFSLKVTKFITAHDSNIACFALTMDGQLLATASIKGTLIRIFNTMDGTQLQEVRRGAEKAEIYSICFSPSMQWMVVSSDRGTIHTFNLRIQVEGENASSPASDKGAGIVRQNLTSRDAPASPGPKLSSSLSFMRGMLPKYFSSEWSFAQFHLPEVTRYIAAFGAKNTVLIVGMDGSFYRCSFDPVNGGAMVQLEHVRFLKAESN